MKRLKKVTTLTMMSALVLFGLSTEVSAEVVSEGQSDADIRFIPGDDGPTSPVDPENPEEELPTDPDDREEGDPIDPPTGQAGPLSLDFVSSVDFGEHPIEGNTQTYESTTLRPFIQVTDKRGTGAGWSVTASASSFEITVDEETEETLSGSVLTFSNGKAVSAGNSTDPASAQEVVLATDGATATVVNAVEDAGLGTWVNRWFPSTSEAELNNNVTLEVPGGVATTGAHTATVAWTLTDAPGQSGQ